MNQIIQHCVDATVSIFKCDKNKERFQKNNTDVLIHTLPTAIHVLVANKLLAHYPHSLTYYNNADAAPGKFNQHDYIFSRTYFDGIKEALCFNELVTPSHSADPMDYILGDNHDTEPYTNHTWRFKVAKNAPYTFEFLKTLSLTEKTYSDDEPSYDTKAATLKLIRSCGIGNMPYEYYCDDPEDNYRGKHWGPLYERAKTLLLDEYPQLFETYDLGLLLSDHEHAVSTLLPFIDIDDFACIAIQHASFGFLETLTKFGVDLTEPKYLIIAAAVDRFSICKKLIDLGCPITALSQTYYNDTPPAVIDADFIYSITPLKDENYQENIILIATALGVDVDECINRYLKP